LPKHNRDGRCRQKFFNKIITGDETWRFAFDPETKRQSSEWVGETSLRPKKLKSPKVLHQAMLINFFDSQGVVHKESIPEGKTVNADFYIGVMDRLLKPIQQVRPAAFCSRDFFLLHDNAPAHTAAFTNFLPPKMLQPFITRRTLHIYLRQTIFCSPSLK
jgi:hypothetical protein